MSVTINEINLRIRYRWNFIDIQINLETQTLCKTLFVLIRKQFHYSVYNNINVFETVTHINLPIPALGCIRHIATKR